MEVVVVWSVVVCNGGCAGVAIGASYVECVDP